MPTNGYKFFVTKAKAEKFIDQFFPSDFEENVRSMKAKAESTNTETACISHTWHDVSTHVRFHGSAGSGPFMSVAVEFVRSTYSDEDIRKEFTLVEKAGGQGCTILKKNQPATDQI